MNLPAWLSTEVVYVVLLFLLFVVPKFLQRFRIPSALTALTFGAVAGMGFGLLRHDETIGLLSTLGIVALFLFAGLDVDVAELRRGAVVIGEHILARLLLLGICTLVLAWTFSLEWRPTLLVALALLTPSTGFILDSLERWGLSDQERFWVRSKAIATELVALGILFVILQSTSLARLSIAGLTLIAMVAILPAVFRWFAKVVVPHAPKSEFGFLIMVAVACALLTRSLGVYYLVGAFAVGMAALQFRQKLPSFASAPMMNTVEAFASLFVPFYFFHAGVALSADYFSPLAIGAATAFLAAAIPLRLGAVALHRWMRFSEPWRLGLRVGVSMLPTTVFTLVLVDILRETFSAPPFLLGALVIYTFVNTLVPSLFFRVPAAEFADELVLGAGLDQLEVDGSTVRPPSRAD